MHQPPAERCPESSETLPPDIVPPGIVPPELDASGGAGETPAECADTSPVGPACDFDAGPLTVGPARPRASRGRWPVAVSLFLHASVAAAIIQVPMAETGLAPVSADAISIEFVTSNVLDQAVLSEIADAAAALAPTAPQDGEAADSLAAAEPVESVDARPVADDAPEPVEATETTDAEEFDAVVTGAGPEAEITPPSVTKPAKEPAPQKVTKVEKKRETEKTTEVTRKPTERKTDTGKDDATRAKGGVAARGTSDRQSKGGKVSASAGSIVGYAARVRARVASNKPSSAGKRGTAVVSFGVTRGGGLAYARLARSSGNAALDQAAVSAVRRAAPFPAPPAGASASQLSFSVPFHFR